MRLRLRALFHRREVERELEDELAFHLAMQEAANRDSGMSEGEAQSGGPGDHRRGHRDRRLRGDGCGVPAGAPRDPGGPRPSARRGMTRVPVYVARRGYNRAPMNTSTVVVARITA
jgi:hypothetical protein